jgi:hypothetical protein
MKWIGYLVLFVGLVVFPLIGTADTQVTLSLDPNGEEPTQYKIYQRLDGEEYDYANPIQVLGLVPDFTVTLPDLHPAPPAATIDEAAFNRGEQQIYLTWSQSSITETIRYYWVSRSAIPPDLESADSNEVSHDITGTSSVTRWEVYYSLTSGGPWERLDTVTNDGQAEASLTNSLTAAPDDQLTTVYFTVVAFYSDDTFSPNSAEVSIEVDRRQLEPPILTKQVVIPVQ